MTSAHGISKGSLCRRRIRILENMETSVSRVAGAALLAGVCIALLSAG